MVQPNADGTAQVPGTGYRYPATMKSTPDTAFVEPFGASSPDAARLGGKGASLSRLVSLGHRVPPGFTITAEAFVAGLQAMGLGPMIGRIRDVLAGGEGDLAALGQAVQEGLAGSSIPERVLAPVLAEVEALRLWQDNRDGLIVRSSATVEDSSSLSFAGIFESIPIARPEELEPTIREVWSSVFSPRALAYLRESGLSEVPTMAVVVQRFLEAERSGVMFTRFTGPDGAQQILVEHVEGTAEKLVRGEVTPDRLWMGRPAHLAEDSAGRLAAVHARELARLADRLEESFGGPQDVEWCIYDGAVHVVQSRPITAGLAGPASAPTAGLEGVEPILRGVAASPGAGTGRVHLVFNIEQALALERGRVLVTPMTNPDMVVAMRNSAAIVTDVGGMICHAAIVSRELGLPCVVGTETASATLAGGQEVTVDGSGGAVYDGILDLGTDEAPRRPSEWPDVWAVWHEATGGRPDLVPVVSNLAALESAPASVEEAVLAPDADLRADRYGLWNDLEGMTATERAAALAGFAGRLAETLRTSPLATLWLMSLGSVPLGYLDEVVPAVGDDRVRLLDRTAPDPAAPPVVLDPRGEWPPSRAAVPLGSAATVRDAGLHGGRVRLPSVGGVEEAIRAGLDTLKFFGHTPGVKVASMPDPEWRRGWWDVLPEYGRYHAEFGTERQSGSYEWLEVRPELVISSLLKSLVQPGFEMVPRVMGFAGIGPMHIKWIRCRYHFRADVFAAVWAAIVRATWDPASMADLMRRVRRSYDQLDEVLVLFPRTDEEVRALTPERIVALITSWWPRWVEFFALCWFIQAQGDDVSYPFIEETVNDNLARIGEPPGDLAWPGTRELILPTTPVMSGDYMASVGRLREALLEAGLTEAAQAEAALGRGEAPDIAALLDEHLRNWHWMRDRDLLFEPWDTPSRVIATALRTEPHAVVPYEENLRRNLLSLSFHVDLAHASGRAGALAHHARFLHDLNVERENHHILWLKDSYPLRRVVLEVERRLIALGSLEPGDVFFLQAPELIEAAANLPSPLPADVVARVKNRRLGFENEARLSPPGAPAADPEDDYY
jgi:phosphohistidine swiveling domain-containing protein